jgi:hypothetical protein
MDLCQICTRMIVLINLLRNINFYSTCENTEFREIWLTASNSCYVTSELYSLNTNRNLEHCQDIG